MSEAARPEGEQHDSVVPPIMARPDGDATEPARPGVELKLLPYIPAQEEPLRARREERFTAAEREVPVAKPPRDWGRFAAAASLAGVVRS